MRLAILVGLILVFVFSLVIYDYSELNSYTENSIVSDKWHTVDCSPIYDGEGTYLGESCSDRFVLVLSNSETRREYVANRADFSEFKIDENVCFTYDVGKLGGIWNQNIYPGICTQ